MSGRDAGARRPPLPLLLALAVLVQAARAAAQASSEAESPANVPVSVRGADSVTANTVQEAVRLASRWLAEAECQQVFFEFTDKAGRKLSDNLRIAEQTGSQYLRWLIFWDGKHEPACAWGDAFATTQPGSRVVRLCPVFKKLQSDPAHAAAIVIHEELHSLGLGENPPTSLEITARVVARCHDGAASAGLR